MSFQERRQELSDLCEGLTVEQKFAASIIYINAYNEHKKLYGSFNPARLPKGADYTGLMNTRYDFMLDQAADYVESLKQLH